MEKNIYYIIFKFYNKHLDLELLIKTTSFINIENPAEYKWQKDNNKNRLNEIKILKKLNPDNFSSIIFENNTHMLYDKIRSACVIGIINGTDHIKQIKNTNVFEYSGKELYKLVYGDDNYYNDIINILEMTCINNGLCEIKKL